MKSYKIFATIGLTIALIVTSISAAPMTDENLAAVDTISENSKESEAFSPDLEGENEVLESALKYDVEEVEEEADEEYSEVSGEQVDVSAYMQEIPDDGLKESVLDPVTEDTDIGSSELLNGVTSKITVTGGTEGVDYIKADDGTLTVMTDTPLVLDGGGNNITTEQIVLGVVGDDASDINVTLKDLKIIKTSDTTPVKIPDGYSENVRITIAGGNELQAGQNHAAIEKNSDSNDGTLFICGEGSLLAVGGEKAAGIGAGPDTCAANITISGGTVMAAGGQYGSGIGGGYHGAGTDILISGGKVNATGGRYGAGIGGGEYADGSNIEITGGTITATGVFGSGIGGGNYGTGADISVSGETVITASSEEGAGIGGGRHGAGKDIQITGGTVTAKSKGYGAGIGSGGESGNVQNITIDGGTITAISEKGAASIGVGQFGVSDSIFISNASVKTVFSKNNQPLSSIPYDEEGSTVYPISIPHYGESKISYKLHSTSAWNKLTFPSFHKDDDMYYLWLAEGIYDFKIGSHELDYIPVNDDTEVEVLTKRIVLDDIPGSRLEILSEDQYKIDEIVYDCSGATDGYVIEQRSSEPFKTKHIVITDAEKITVKHLNVQPARDFAAILDLSQSDLEFNVEGENTFVSPEYCAGIEKPLETGNLTFSGNGTIIAKGGTQGAGIGGGRSKEEIGTNDSSSDIVFSGPTVVATGGSGGAGIGGGYEGSGMDITITDGAITASTVGSLGAGIGGGNYGDGKNITITGGTVVATGASPYGAGIGSGGDGIGQNIYISGGIVTATGGRDGAGIGGGNGGQGTDINITGGTVTATGVNSAGIGGGRYGNGTNISISGGNCVVNGNFGIGAGKDGSTSNIYITGGNIKAKEIGATPVKSSLDSTPLVLNVIAGYNSGDGIPFESIEGAEYYNFDGIVAHDDGCFYLYLPEGVSTSSYSKYKVSFNTDCETDISPQTVSLGEKIVEPTGLVKSGYLLEGWYKQRWSDRWNFDQDLVTENITLYARWLSAYTVNFYTGCDTEISPQTVASGGKLTKPEDPIKTGYTFMGWFTSPSSTDAIYKWDFDNNTVSRNQTLYAGWKDSSTGKPAYTITFITGCDASVPSQTVIYGERIVKPSNPKRDGYIFKGWYTRENTIEENYKWNFTSRTVNSNMTLYAGWEEGSNYDFSDPDAELEPANDGTYAYTLLLGENYTINLPGLDKKSLKTSDSKVAAVTKAGVVQGKKVGVADVTCDVNGETKTLHVSVIYPAISATKNYVLVGEELPLSVKGTTMSNITWSVNNDKASITDDGILTGNAAGNVKVTAIIHKKKYTVSVTVENPKFAKASYTINAGKATKIALSGTKQAMRVSYYIDDENIATIAPDGKIVGLSPGTTTLSAVLAGKTYSTVITVK